MAEQNELTCQQARDLASSEHCSLALLSHIQTCDRCLDSLLGVLMHDQVVEVPDDFVRRLLVQAPPPGRSRTPQHSAFRIGGAFLFALSVGWYRPELIALSKTIDGALLLATMSAQATFIIVFAARWTRV